MVRAMQVIQRRWRVSAGLGGVVAAVLAAGCASPPRPAPSVGVAVVRPAPALEGRDGADPMPPVGLERVADAEPRLEPVRSGGPNKPYEALGLGFVPITHERAFSERGLASWYGRKFHGRRTASGEPYDMYAMTAAHPTLPIPSYARVRNPANGREVVVRINDRGPFHAGRIIDLSYTAALRLDLLRHVAPVEVERITPDEIRAGDWRRPQAQRVAGVSGAATEAAPPAVVPPPAATPPAAAPLAAGFWVQLGAFRDAEGANAFQRKVAVELEWLSSRLAVFGDAALYRLQAGPFPNRDAARDAADSIRIALQLVTVVVERR